MILLTGGAGYIGSHMGVALAEAGLQFVVFDNFSNSTRKVLHRMAKIGSAPLAVEEGDVRDAVALDRLFGAYPITSVIHFAGLKSVAESVQRPGIYYDNNVAGSISLVLAMARANVKQLVFSSSATVYGTPATLPVNESASLSPTNPYGSSKLMVERILADMVVADPTWRIASLRYFNPVGAHPSGLLGESPVGTPANLLPFIGQVAAGLLPELKIFGGDYETHDGTGVRDYIHVMDLVEGHLAAIKALSRSAPEKLLVANLGTGRGISVLEMVKAFTVYTGQAVPYRIVARRPGDVASCFADVGHAWEFLDWAAKRGLQEMCEDAWRWQRAGVSVPQSPP